MKNKRNLFLFFLRILTSALFFIALCLTFAGATGFSAPVGLQLFPAIDRKAWGVVFTLLLLTVLFGRFYCSVLCPLGFLQEFAGFLFRRKARIDANRLKLRYAVAGLTWAAFLGGSVFLISLTDPYSTFGRIAAFIRNPSFLAGGLALGGIILLVIWKQRIFCTSFCPIGTILGLCAKISPFKAVISDRCVKCHRCVSACPAGCINPDDKTLDDERCVRCLKCVAVCPANAIGLKETPSPQKTDLNRRSFLTGSITTATAVTAGLLFARASRQANNPPEQARPICPPGATTLQEFASKCTNCQLCVAGCKGRVLRPRSKRYQTVHLEYGQNYCLYDCNRCCSVCPTGALTALSLKEKRLRRIGLAEFSREKCVGCGLCADVCPKGAIAVTDIDGEDKAVLNADRCIGCGACVAACPLPEKAVSVTAVVIQNRITERTPLKKS